MSYSFASSKNLETSSPHETKKPNTPSLTPSSTNPKRSDCISPEGFKQLFQRCNLRYVSLKNDVKILLWKLYDELGNDGLYRILYHDEPVGDIIEMLEACPLLLLPPDNCKDTNHSASPEYAIKREGTNKMKKKRRTSSLLSIFEDEAASRHVFVDSQSHNEDVNKTCNEKKKETVTISSD